MKKDKLPPDVESLRNAVARFTKHADRGAALVAAAWVDDALEKFIQENLRDDKKIKDEMFRPEGPLGSFSARINFAYMLNLIQPTIKEDLHRIRGIRNEFAHSRCELRFTTPTIRDRCQQLHTAQTCRRAHLAVRGPKQRYLITAHFLAEYLMSVTSQKKRSPIVAHIDPYQTWIRRTVTDQLIASLQKEIEAIGK